MKKRPTLQNLKADFSAALQAAQQAKPQPISQDEILFANALNNGDGASVRMRQDKIHPTPRLGKQKTQQKLSLPQTASNCFYFSDEFIPELPTQGPICFIQVGHDPYLTKQLRRGDYYPDLILDLHGFSKENAKLELAALIDHCRKRHIHCACIVHGIGEHVLKKKIPHYLVQHPAIIAFHQAPLEWGGKGALLILIEHNETDLWTEKK